MTSYYAISDLHADFPSNLTWIENFCHKNKSCFQEDVLIIAGDISHKVHLIEHVLLKFKGIFKEVAYVYGNHELWKDKKHKISALQKIDIIEDFCRKNSIRIDPFLSGDTLIVPVYSWYDDEFASAEAKTDPSLQGWADKYLCDFNKSDKEMCFFFHAKNKPVINHSGRVISFSHFLPRKELLPSDESLLFKGLPAVSGNILIDQYIRSVGSKLHITGHAHIDFDVMLDGIRYVQNSLKYPFEQRFSSTFGLLKIE